MHTHQKRIELKILYHSILLSYTMSMIAFRCLTRFRWPTQKPFTPQAFQMSATCSIQHFKKSLWQLNNLVMWKSVHPKVQAHMLLNVHGRRWYCSGQSSKPDISVSVPDLLAQQLERSDSLSSVLEIVDRHVSVMNDSHILNALQLVEKYREHNQNYEIHCDSRFQVLCQHVQKKARFFTPEELLTAFKLCSALRLSANSKPVQSLLHLLRHSINDLEIENLIFLGFLLRKQKESSKIIEALKVAVPLVVALETQAKADAYDLYQLLEILKFFADFQESVPPKVLNVLLKRIYCEIENVPLSKIQAHKLLVSLSCLNLYEDQLLDVVAAILTDECKELTINELVSVTRCCCILGYYHPDLCDAVSEEYVAKNIPMAQTYTFLQMHVENSHFSRLMADYVIQFLISDPALLAHPKFSLLTLARFFTISDYRPPDLDIILQRMLDRKEQVHRLQAALWPYLEFAKEMAVLGKFDHEVLSTVFDSNNVDLLLNDCRKGKLHLYTIYMCAQAHFHV